MSSPSDILNKKGTLPILIVLITSSMGLGVNNHLTDNPIDNNLYESLDDKLFQHVSAEAPHPGTKVTLDYFEKYIEDDKLTTREIKQGILDLKESDKEILQQLKLLNKMLCQHNGYDCN